LAGILKLTSIKLVGKLLSVPCLWIVDGLTVVVALEFVNLGLVLLDCKNIDVVLPDEDDVDMAGGKLSFR